MLHHGLLLDKIKQWKNVILGPTRSFLIFENGETCIWVTSCVGNLSIWFVSPRPSCFCWLNLNAGVSLRMSWQINIPYCNTKICLLTVLKILGNGTPTNLIDTSLFYGTVFDLFFKFQTIFSRTSITVIIATCSCARELICLSSFSTFTRDNFSKEVSPATFQSILS